jgi:hypothetical protein
LVGVIDEVHRLNPLRIVFLVTSLRTIRSNELFSWKISQCEIEYLEASPPCSSLAEYFEWDHIPLGGKKLKVVAGIFNIPGTLIINDLVVNIAAGLMQK